MFDILQVAVAERSGLIRLYDVTTLSAFMSVECGMSPLKSISWLDDDPTRIHALAASMWCTFDTSQSL